MAIPKQVWILLISVALQDSVTGQGVAPPPPRNGRFEITDHDSLYNLILGDLARLNLSTAKNLQAFEKSLDSKLEAVERRIGGKFEQQVSRLSATVDKLAKKMDSCHCNMSSSVKKENPQAHDPANTVPGSCKAYYDSGERRNGVYRLRVGGQVINASCDMTTDGGGWTVFQRRQDGSVDFYRNWAAYRSGFGNAKGEFWLGNRFIHLLTVGGRELRVDFDGDRYIKFENFSVSAENDKFRLTLGRQMSGNVQDNLSYHKGLKFTTKDQDNDKMGGENCAQSSRGAYWYGGCYWSNLNGPYGVTDSYKALLWGHKVYGFYPTLVEMKFR